MDFFSNTKPNLINGKTLKNMDKILSLAKPMPVKAVSDTLYSFYDIYISPNIFVLIMLAIFAIFLAYRYWSKNDQLEDFRPAFNPTIPVDQQQSFVHYLPDDDQYEVNEQISTINQIIPPKPPKPILPDVPKPVLFKEVNTGTSNTYYDSIDHIINNPFDWPNNFNSSTSQSVAFMAGQNKAAFDELENIINKENHNLLHSNVIGGNYCDYNPNVSNGHIDKPFN